MKKLLKLLPFLTIILLLSSCSDDDDETIIPVSNTIVDVAINNDLTSLVDAVIRADLAETLAGPGPFTVFAPTNAAFQDLLDSNADWNSVDDIPVATLRAVLLFHTLSGEVRSTDLSDTYVNTLSTGPNEEALSLQVEVTGAIEFNGDAKPVTVDVEASNGVVHVIDKVMMPPTIVNLALNNTAFTRLVEALTDPRHTNINFIEVLNGEGPYTVFAPTNQAFQDLLDLDDDWVTIGDIPIATLEAVLLYHVVGGNVQSDQLTNGDVPTLGGSDITIDLTNGAQIKTATQTVNIIITDVQGSNGVVHAIDAVLLPM
jgi:transforming growth factor-beta-induced protein